MSKRDEEGNISETVEIDVDKIDLTKEEIQEAIEDLDRPHEFELAEIAEEEGNINVDKLREEVFLR